MDAILTLERHRVFNWLQFIVNCYSFILINIIKKKLKIRTLKLITLCTAFSSKSLTLWTCSVLCSPSFIFVYWGVKNIGLISVFTDYVKPSRPNLGQGEKINLNFCFHFSLWCLKRFYEGLIFLIHLSEMCGAVRVNLNSIWDWINPIHFQPWVSYLYLQFVRAHAGYLRVWVYYPS